MKTKFNKKVRENRKKLKEAGFGAPSIHNWEYGKKVPMFETAVKLSAILDMPIMEIPYWKPEMNRP
ncbi:helix-turn-helix domain-containing protein [bacterium]|nr:helix-turn-helix domain-containing protein [bacterium]